MKINFKGTITPTQYAEGEYYVEGVGEAIKLINEGKISEGEKKCDKMIAIYPEGKWGYFCKRSATLLSGLDNRKKEALKNLKEGDIVENAKVKATTDWGIFLDIDGIDALLHT